MWGQPSGRFVARLITWLPSRMALIRSCWPGVIEAGDEAGFHTHGWRQAMLARCAGAAPIPTAVIARHVIQVIGRL